MWRVYKMCVQDVCTRCVYKMCVQDVCTRCVYKRRVYALRDVVSLKVEHTRLCTSLVGSLRVCNVNFLIRKVVTNVPVLPLP